MVASYISQDLPPPTMAKHCDLIARSGAGAGRPVGVKGTAGDAQESVYEQMFRLVIALLLLPCNWCAHAGAEGLHHHLALVVDHVRQAWRVEDCDPRDSKGGVARRGEGWRGEVR